MLKLINVVSKRAGWWRRKSQTLQIFCELKTSVWWLLLTNVLINFLRYFQSHNGNQSSNRRFISTSKYFEILPFKLLTSRRLFSLNERQRSPQLITLHSTSTCVRVCACVSSIWEINTCTHTHMHTDSSVGISRVARSVAIQLLSARMDQWNTSEANLAIMTHTLTKTQHTSVYSNSSNHFGSSDWIEQYVIHDPALFTLLF